MFKKFYISLSVFSLSICFIFSFSDISTDEYFYPIQNNKNISSYYGMRTLNGRYHFHNAIDIPAVDGTKVYSIDNGVISYIGFDKYGYGNYIIIHHDNSYKSLYSHLSENIIVKLGQRVNKGEHVCYVGPTILPNGLRNGNTTGPHLHFSVFNEEGKHVDPLSLKYKNR